MNKMELVLHIAQEADISQAAARRALDALTSGIAKTLKRNEPVVLVGFGTFLATKCASRNGRNPRTGESIKIKSAKVPRFRPGKTLKSELN